MNTLIAEAWSENLSEQASLFKHYLKYRADWIGQPQFAVLFPQNVFHLDSL
ncbi:exodeoxyribonuclease V subunit gamma [Legionella brunensis]|uniref:exodeoxyribonuclease V subunit gamma n=1 Tax=Legionella brunensis TaxID=29422 RepID=UPI0013EF729D|nr:exodeoxyribonuclease V subunit gamma [Legionella brunensis]